MPDAGWCLEYQLQLGFFLRKHFSLTFTNKGPTEVDTLNTDMRDLR